MYRYAVALTGGIATGKSSVAKIFRDRGYEIIDADEVAHDILDKQSDAIADMFGQEYVSEDRVDRKKLGALVFSDEARREELESLLHPLIRDEIEAKASELDKKKKTYLVDVPLFYETKRYNIEDVIVVYVPREIQLERLISRDSLSLPEADERINAQMDIEQKKEKATYLIDNSGTRNELLRSCSLVDKRLKER